MMQPYIQDFIFSDTDKNYNLVHVTDRISALGIIEYGLCYDNPIYKTADLVKPNKDWLEFWWHQRKFYGNQIVVLSISKLLLEHCTLLCKYELNGNISPFQLLSNKIEKSADEDDDSQIILGNNFIKGTIDLIDGVIYRNEKFDPYYFKQVKINEKKIRESLTQKAN